MKALQNSKLMLGLISGVLLLGLMTAFQAQAAWTKSENSRVKALERRIEALETKLLVQSSTQKKTIRFLAIRGNLQICPGDSYPVLNFPFSAGEGYYAPARMSDYGNFNETIQLITCAVDIVQPK